MCVTPGTWLGSQGGIYWIPTGAFLASAPHRSCSLGLAFTLSQAKSWLCYPLTGAAPQLQLPYVLEELRSTGPGMCLVSLDKRRQS